MHQDHIRSAQAQLQLNSDEMPAHHDSKIYKIIFRVFLLQHTNSSPKPAFGLAGDVRAGFSEILVCGGGAPRERRGDYYLEMAAGLMEYKNSQLIRRRAVKLYRRKYRG